MLAWSEALCWGWVSTAALFGSHRPARLLDSSFLLVAYTNQKSGLKGDPVSGAADSMGRDWEAPLQGFWKHGCMMGMATGAFVSGARPASSPTGQSSALQSSAASDLGGESVCSQLWGGHLQYVRKEAGQDPQHIWQGPVQNGNPPSGSQTIKNVKRATAEHEAKLGDPSKRRSQAGKAVLKRDLGESRPRIRPQERQPQGSSLGPHDLLTKTKRTYKYRGKKLGGHA